MTKKRPTPSEAPPHRLRDIHQIRRDNTATILREQFQGVKKRMASALDMQPSYLGRVLNPTASGSRHIGDDTARLFEKAGNKPTNWLDNDHTRAQVDTVSTALPVRGRVPVLSWTEAAVSPAPGEPFSPPAHCYWLDTSEALSEYEAFALQIEGDTMFDAANPRSFPVGSYIVVKRADLRPPASGDFVVLRMADERRATCRQVQWDGDRMLFKALDRVTPLIAAQPPPAIIGVVVEKVLRDTY